MRVLVTGGAGYIGSITIRQLLGAGHAPVAFDSLVRGQRASIGNDVPLVVGDVRDRGALDALMASQPFDAVMHLAALKSPAESLSHPSRYFSVNVEGTAVLLEAMRHHGIVNLVVSSSCAVYGIPETLPIGEGAATRPTTPYGASKLIAEQLVPWYRTFGLRFAILRYFNAAGATDDGTLGENWTQAVNLVPAVLRAAFGQGPAVKVYGTDYPTPDGTAIRDYIHVLDLADAHIAAMEHLAQHDAALTLNLGTGVGASVLDIIRAAERVTLRSVPYRLSDRRPGDPPEVYADPALAAATLGWRARRRLDDVMDSAARWHERGTGR
jgi:UDP-arabinose 4-epimerase